MFQEQILIQREEEHSKFWMVGLADENDKKTVLVHYGRLGTQGQHQTKAFPNEWRAQDFIATKVREKKNKGYQSTSRRQYDLLHTQAAIVGTANKCSDLQWVEASGPVTPGIESTFDVVSDQRIQEPGYEPYLATWLSTRKEYGGRSEFVLLLGVDQAWELRNHMTVSPSGPEPRHWHYTGVPVPITRDHPLSEITDRIEASIGKLFA